MISRLVRLFYISLKILFNYRCGDLISNTYSEMMVFWASILECSDKEHWSQSLGILLSNGCVLPVCEMDLECLLWSFCCFQTVLYRSFACGSLVDSRPNKCLVELMRVLGLLVLGSLVTFCSCWRIFRKSSTL